MKGLPPAANRKDYRMPPLEQCICDQCGRVAFVAFQFPPVVMSREGQRHGGRIPLNLPEPIVTRLHYQGKTACLSSPIYDFTATGRFALV
jgi:hypothetical protein